jgi:3-dehydroquinate dehydratase-2
LYTQRKPVTAQKAIRTTKRNHYIRSMKISIINGPNLNLLGVREPDIYGHTSFEHFLQELSGQYPELEFSYFQSNSEGDLIDHLHEEGFLADGIVINAGAYSHTSYALADAIHTIKAPVIEVHISNTYARESFRHKDVLSGVCMGCIVGLGLNGYKLAVDHLIHYHGNS